MDDSKPEYRCPFCLEWILKKDFKNHQAGQHQSTPDIEIQPESVEDIERRFIFLGLWDDR